MSANLYSVIASRITDRSAPFAILRNGDTVRYADLESGSGRFANAMAGLGVQRGDRVAVQTGKLLDCLFIYLACLRLGAVYLPLNPAYTGAEVDYFLGDAEPRLLIADSEREAVGQAIASARGVRLATVDKVREGSLQRLAREANAGFATVEAGADDLAAILYTSGTTGRSKGAMTTHGNLLSNALALIDVWRITASDVLVHALPIYHTHGLFVATNTIMLAGASMLFHERFDTHAIIEDLPRATLLMGVPTFYSRLLADERFTAESAADMRLFISGSAPLSPEVHRRFRERTGQAILERYGMTETNMITSNPYDGERRPGTVGFPLPGVEVRIADPKDGTPLPQGEIGVIELHGPNVFKGYWRMPEKTAEEFRADGFFITGDLGYIDPDGYVTISGRDKDLIISGGFNVYPAEIEKAIDSQPGIAESAVIGLPHDDLGEAVTAVVVARKGAQIDEDRLRTALEPMLARYKLPKRVIVMDELPRNSMGKVQKVRLREELALLYRETGGTGA